MSQIESIIAQLKQLDHQYCEQQVSKTETQNEDCCICLDEIATKKNTTTLHCGHTIHLNCFMEFILSGQQSNSDKCPLCRGSVGLTQDIKTKLSSGSSNNINRNNIMMLTIIQKRIINILKQNNQYAYTPQRIADKIYEDCDIMYDEKIIRINCNLLAEGKRVNKQRDSRRFLYGYLTNWDNQ